MIDVMMEIIREMCRIELVFGWVIGYNTTDTFTLSYGTEKKQYLETWHGVDGNKLMKVFNKMGWKKEDV